LKFLTPKSPPKKYLPKVPLKEITPKKYSKKIPKKFLRF